jgi:hypothetical protein
MKGERFSATGEKFSLEGERFSATGEKFSLALLALSQVVNNLHNCL